MTETLTSKKCQPCEGSGQPLTKDKAKEYLSQVPGWELDPTGKMISRTYKTRNFMEAVRFTQKVAEIAENENHHPDIHLTGYRNLRIELSTHAIGGLSENDFILAAKINTLPVQLKIEQGGKADV